VSIGTIPEKWSAVSGEPPVVTPADTVSARWAAASEIAEESWSHRRKRAVQESQVIQNLSNPDNPDPHQPSLRRLKKSNPTA
jgi:hypothetical protein